MTVDPVRLMSASELNGAIRHMRLLRDRMASAEVVAVADWANHVLIGLVEERDRQQALLRDATRGL